jgi:hypothetical protein
LGCANSILLQAKTEFAHPHTCNCPTIAEAIHADAAPTSRAALDGLNREPHREP